MGTNYRESGDAIRAEKDGSGNWVLWNETDDSLTNPLLKIDENTGEVTVNQNTLNMSGNSINNILSWPNAGGFINVLAESGVEGDGVNDDTTGLQNAIDKTASGGANEGAIIFFPASNYKITSSLKFYSGQTFMFSPKGEIQANGCTGLEPNDTTSGTNQCAFYTPRVVGDDTSNTIGLNLERCSDTFVISPLISNFDEGIVLQNNTSGGGYYNTIQAPRIYNCRIGIRIGSSSGSNPNATTIRGRGTIMCDSTWRTNNPADYGIKVIGNSSQTLNSVVIGSVAIENYNGSTGANEGIYLDYCTEIEIENTRIENVANGIHLGLNTSGNRFIFRSPYFSGISSTSNWFKFDDSLEYIWYETGTADGFIMGRGHSNLWHIRGKPTSPYGNLQFYFGNLNTQSWTEVARLTEGGALYLAGLLTENYTF